MGVDLVCKDGSSASDHGGECPETKAAREKRAKQPKKPMPRFKQGRRGDLNALLGAGSIAEDVGREMDQKKKKKR